MSVASPNLFAQRTSSSPFPSKETLSSSPSLRPLDPPASRSLDSPALDVSGEYTDKFVTFVDVKKAILELDPTKVYLFLVSVFWWY